jgi:HAD superfamily 5'-nucleotidase-like hydrolase
MSLDQSYNKKLKQWQRFFVNRSLNLASIKAIGFDMDHTLAMYNREAFEALAFRETLKKFIEAGYPQELLRLKFDPNFIIRGLLVDRDRGNLLKVDCHKYVKLAFHGHQKLSKADRHRIYNQESFKAGDFLSVDTFFALSEVQLFTEIVEYMNSNPQKIKKSYREVYADLRRFIDQSHADGSIKNVVLGDIASYIKKDKYLPEMLTRQIEAGKSLWLITNSRWDYTQAVMNYILDEPTEEYPTWRDYFDFVVVGAGKPGFFHGHQPFYEVMTDSGLLKLASGPLEPNCVYHGGNAALFQKHTGYRGDEILYAGDHIYGDIMRSKDTYNWRTLLILEEIESELEKVAELKDNLAEISQKLELREIQDEKLQILRSKININNKQADRARQGNENKKAHYLLKENEKLHEKAIESEKELRTLEMDVRRLIEEREAAVHPIWGELMKVGLERSRFADQVSNFACIYTSRITNMRFYSPFKRFTSTLDAMPHEA